VADDPMAFPGPTALSSKGMALLDYFAAAALQGLLAGDPDATCEDSAIWAYKHANTMLAEREKRNG